jgi:hypothetical protein
LPDTSTHIGSRVNHYHVRAHFGYLLLDTFLRALSNGKHRDDGCDTDNDAEHGKESA